MQRLPGSDLQPCEIAPVGEKNALAETNMENQELTMSVLVYYNLGTKGLVQNLTKEEALRPSSPKTRFSVQAAEG